MGFILLSNMSLLCLREVETPHPKKTLALTLLLLQFLPDHLPDPPLFPPLLHLLRWPGANLVQGAVGAGSLPWRQPVQAGQAGSIVALPGSKLLLGGCVGEEPAPPQTAAGPHAVLERRERRQDSWRESLDV